MSLIINLQNLPRPGSKLGETLKLYPTELIRRAFMIPGEGGLQPFGFEGRRYMEQIHDQRGRRKLLCCGRQTGKSTTLGNLLLAYSLLQAYFKSLYIAPTFIQTSQFSRDRLAQPIMYSDVLRTFFQSGHVTDRVNHKECLNGSEIRLRNCYLSADRVRGLMSDMLVIDEFQDILVELLPVIESTLFTSRHKMRIYSGTPLSTDNALGYYHERFSTKNEWSIPCDRHYPMHWNVAGEENLPTDIRHGLVCSDCHKPIDPMHAEAQWRPTNETAVRALVDQEQAEDELMLTKKVGGFRQMVIDPDEAIEATIAEAKNRTLYYDGYRIPQLIDPNANWSEILDQHMNWPRARFFNEVLGQAYDSGMRPLTWEDIRKNCDPDMSMLPGSSLSKNLGWATRLARAQRCYIGVDWGTSESSSHTFITVLGLFGDGRMRIVWCKRLIGADSEPEAQLRIIDELIEQFRPDLVCCDYGGGFDRNARLRAKYGSHRIQVVQYSGMLAQIARFSEELGYWQVRRTEIMAATFDCIKRGDVFVFPRWEETEDPLGSDLMAVISEYNQKMHMTQYSRTPGVPDDGHHSLGYALFGACLRNPRPDIYVPGSSVDLPNGNW
mgnify:CR=1 FL=1